MKLTNKQLRQIIKEELKKVLEEGLPSLGLAGLMGKAVHNITNRDSAPESERIYRRRGSPVTFTRPWEEEEPINTSIEEVANALRDYGFAANVSGNGGINIKYKNPSRWSGREVEMIKIYPNTNLSLQDALQDAIDQITAQDPDSSIRSKASRRMGSTINVDDPMMERKRRR